MLTLSSPHPKINENKCECPSEQCLRKLTKLSKPISGFQGKAVGSYGPGKPPPQAQENAYAAIRDFKGRAGRKAAGQAIFAGGRRRRPRQWRRPCRRPPAMPMPPAPDHAVAAGSACGAGHANGAGRPVAPMPMPRPAVSAGRANAAGRAAAPVVPVPPPMPMPPVAPCLAP